MGKLKLTVQQGATLRRAVWWRGPLIDPLSGDPLLDEAGVALPGPYYNLSGYSGRMHVREKPTSPDPPLLALTSANGGIVISTPAIVLHSWVWAATVAPITLSGTQTVDGVPLKVGDRVLVKDQADASTNGIYVVASGAWARAEDANSASELTSPNGVHVYGGLDSMRQKFGGTVNGDTVWAQTVSLGSLSVAQSWTKITELGKFEIVMTATQTASLTKSGYYDVELVAPSGDVYRPLEGAIRLSAEVTR